MKSLIHLFSAIAGLLLLSSCETTYVEEASTRPNRGTTTTTTTEEVTRRGAQLTVPTSTTVQTQTTRAY